MTESPATILVILLSRIILDEVGRVCGLYWRRHLGRSAAVHDGRTTATGAVAEVRSAKGVGSVAVIVHLVTFCFCAGCRPWMCVSFRAQGRKVGQRVMSG